MTLAQWLVAGGIVFIVMGLLIGAGFPLGKLPGDIHIQGKHTQIYVPLTTSLLVSLFLSLIFYLIRK